MKHHSFKGLSKNLNFKYSYSLDFIWSHLYEIKINILVKFFSMELILFKLKFIKLLLVEAKICAFVKKYIAVTLKMKKKDVFY